MWARLRRVFALLRDPRTPKLPRLAVLAAMAYMLWPIDLLPDFAPPLVGYLDDVVLIWTTVRWMFGSADREARRAVVEHSPDRRP